MVNERQEPLDTVLDSALCKTYQLGISAGMFDEEHTIRLEIEWLGAADLREA
jgi:hypothetical protein